MTPSALLLLTARLRKLRRVSVDARPAGARRLARDARRGCAAFAALAARWTARINLVGALDRAATSGTRHVARLRPAPRPSRPPGAATWADLGAGGGFPGIVIAILAARRAGPRVTLVESDARKCAFLRTAARELALDVAVLDARVEAAAPLGGRRGLGPRAARRSTGSCRWSRATSRPAARRSCPRAATGRPRWTPPAPAAGPSGSTRDPRPPTPRRASSS